MLDPNSKEIRELQNATNGRARFIVIALVGIITMGVVVSLISAGILFVVISQYRVRIFSVEIPQQIVNGHTFYGGDTVIVKASKCNLTNAPISVDGTSSWARKSPSYILIQRSIVVGSAYAPLECKRTPFENVLPKDIESGVWRIEGTNTAYDTKGGMQVVPWYTEDFTVLNKTDNTK